MLSFQRSLLCRGVSTLQAGRIQLARIAVANYSSKELPNRPTAASKGETHAADTLDKVPKAESTNQNDNVPPTIDQRTIRERYEQMLKNAVDYEKHVERKSKLAKDMKKSYWEDLHDLRVKGEKRWEAKPALNNARRAIYLPNISGTTLTGQRIHSLNLVKGRVSLVSMCFAQFGERHVNSYIDPFVKEFGTNHKQAQLIEFNIQENYLKIPLLWLSKPYIRRHLSTERHQNYIIHYGNIESIRERIGITNAYLGWVFLVDANQRIRWYAHGMATPQEIESLLRLTKELSTGSS
ncbi:ATPase assembly factor ATP10 [Syncephalis fuscata]|nr:ATPase assembly factor ATP10 [Syncephalis fuscata]